MGGWVVHVPCHGIGGVVQKLGACVALNVVGVEVSPAELFGWVGGWMDDKEVEEIKAVRMSYWKLRVYGQEEKEEVGGWVGGCFTCTSTQYLLSVLAA